MKNKILKYKISFQCIKKLFFQKIHFDKTFIKMSFRSRDQDSSSVRCVSAASFTQNLRKKGFLKLLSIHFLASRDSYAFGVRHVAPSPPGGRFSATRGARCSAPPGLKIKITSFLRTSARFCVHEAADMH